jgi:hypothetical protein
MAYIKIFLSISLIICALSDISTDRKAFVPPVRIPVLLSANFGELRLDHYHSGIDIKTQGVTGKEIQAAADGYIYRITVSPGGFGNALYIKHPSGYMTVYGHLERFAPEIERYVKEKQYEKKSFAINLFLSKETFPVKQGDLIAYSGNSGSSGGPHLHYEIRKSENEKPVNPLLFESEAGDNINPVIEKLFIYPLSEVTVINNKHDIRKLDATGGHGNYYIPTDNEITISGPAGFGIKSFDLLNDSYNKCSVYSIDLIIDSLTVFRYVMDSFSFSESRYINSHIDYEKFIRDKYFVERTFCLPNDRLSVYSNLVNRGIFNFNENRTYTVKIIVADVNKNISNLTFHVRSKAIEEKNTEREEEPASVIMPFNKPNNFISQNIRLNIPSGALYDTLRFIYNYIPCIKGSLSGIHQIHNKFSPVHKAYSLYIKPDSIIRGLESKMIIIQLGDDQKKSAFNTTWKDGYLAAETTAFGNYAIDIDTVPPSISANGLLSDNNLKSKQEMRIRIKDDLSGIKSYWPEIDGNWALFEYDQKNDVLIYRFDEKRIKRNSNHTLTLTVTDNKENVSRLNYNFEW